jgi:hypothetical protein
LAALTLEVYYRYTQHNELQQPAATPVVALDAGRFKLEVKAEKKPPAGTAKIPP